MIAPGAFLRISGSPFLKATRYVYETYRCHRCQAVFPARLPEGIDGESRYDESAKTVIALQKYAMGNPFYRIEAFQRMLGVPVADATQWDLVESLADILYPLYLYLMVVVAHGELVHNDDTPARILSLIQANQQTPPQTQRDLHHRDLWSPWPQRGGSVFQRSPSCG